jgi:hypothetical protein
MASIPRGAGFGRDTNRKHPAQVDFGWTAVNGSRAQRRALKLIRKAAREGHHDAAEVLADLAEGAR